MGQDRECDGEPRTLIQRYATGMADVASSVSTNRRRKGEPIGSPKKESFSRSGNRQIRIEARAEVDIHLDDYV